MPEGYKVQIASAFQRAITRKPRDNAIVPIKHAVTPSESLTIYGQVKGFVGFVIHSFFRERKQRRISKSIENANVKKASETV